MESSQHIVGDERFSTPRAQASTGRSNASFCTPRSSRSDTLLSARSATSSSESEYSTPRNYSVWNASNSTRHIPVHLQSFPSQGTITLPNHGRRDYSRDFRRFDEQNQFNGRSDNPLHAKNCDESTAVGRKQSIDEIFSFARHGKTGDIDRLLSGGLSVNSRDANGNSILAIACQNGNKRVMKLALRYGANINACNFRGNTALHFCYKYGFEQTLGAYLINKGADPNIRNQDGQTCADLG